MAQTGDILVSSPIHNSEDHEFDESRESTNLNNLQILRPQLSGERRGLQRMGSSERFLHPTGRSRPIARTPVGMSPIVSPRNYDNSPNIDLMGDLDIKNDDFYGDLSPIISEPSATSNPHLETLNNSHPINNNTHMTTTKTVTIQENIQPKSRFQNSKRRNKIKKKGERHFPEHDLCGIYEFKRYLGHGSYGHVADCTRLSDGFHVAIKKVPNVFRNETDAKRLLRELVILRTMKEHEAMVGLIDILPPHDLSNFDVLYLVFEFVDTDLAQLMNSPQFFQELHTKYILYQILIGVKYLHSGGVVHRDLKPANILVNENVSCKICDFGLARGIRENVGEYPHPTVHSKLHIKHPNIVSPRSKKIKRNGLARQLTTHVVTRWYRPPEVILLSQTRSHLTAIDMWSIGCILSELLLMIRENAPEPHERKALFPGRSCFPLSATDPFAFNDRYDQLKLILEVIGTPTDEEISKISDPQAQQYLSKLPKKHSVDFRAKFPGSSAQSIDLLRRLLQFDVEKRLTVDEALSHPFLEAVRDHEAERRHPPETFVFEDIQLSMETIVELIVDEILHYNPDLENELQRQLSAFSVGGGTPGTSPSRSSTRQIETIINDDDENDDDLLINGPFDFNQHQS